MNLNINIEEIRKINTIYSMVLKEAICKKICLVIIQFNKFKVYDFKEI